MQIQYTLRLDGNVIYTGSTTTFIVDSLPQEPVYTFTIQGTYNGRSSPISPAYPLSATTNTVPGDQVIEDMITVLGQQVSQTSQQIQNQIDRVSSRIDVDVVQVLHHADDGTVDIKEKLVTINNQTLLNIQTQQSALQQTITSNNQTLLNIQTQQSALQQTITSIDQRLSAKTISDIQQKLSGIDAQTYNLQYQLSKLSQQLNNQTQQLNNQGSSSGGGGVSGAGIAIGVVVGLVIGVIGALVGKKVFQRLASGVFRGYTLQNALMSPGMSLVDEDPE